MCFCQAISPNCAIGVLSNHLGFVFSSSEGAKALEEAKADTNPASLGHHSTPLVVPKELSLISRPVGVANYSSTIISPKDCKRVERATIVCLMNDVAHYASRVSFS